MSWRAPGLKAEGRRARAPGAAIVQRRAGAHAVVCCVEARGCVEGRPRLAGRARRGTDPLAFGAPKQATMLGPADWSLLSCMTLGVPLAAGCLCMAVHTPSGDPFWGIASLGSGWL